MVFEGALIKEQGVTFGIVIVKQHVLSNPSEANRLVSAFQVQLFPGVPVILMAQDGRGTPTYYGRRDIVDFLANVPLEAIPWQQYTLS